MKNVEVCSVCQCEFDPEEEEGGIIGDFGILPVAFCPTCYASMDDMIRQEDAPEDNYHYKLGRMIKKVKAETKWKDIFKIVDEAQTRLKGET